MLAARYRGKIGSWEIWNEPDNPDFWRGSVADYAALLTAGARAVRAADPAAKVVFGGIAGHPQFAAEVLARPEVGPLVDVVNAHAYFETWNGAPLESLPSYVAAFAPALSGGARPLWLAEVGYSDHRPGRVRLRRRPRPLRVRAHAGVSGRAAGPHGHAGADPPRGGAAGLVRDQGLSPPTRPSSVTRTTVTWALPRLIGVPSPPWPRWRWSRGCSARGFARLDDELRVARPAGSEAEVHAFLTAATTPSSSPGCPNGPEIPSMPADRRATIDWKSSRSRCRSAPMARCGSSMPRGTSSQAQRRRSLEDGTTFAIDDLEVRGGTVVVLDLPVRP